MTGRLEVLVDGEWHEVPGIVFAEIHQEPPLIEEPPTDARIREAMDRLSKSMKPAIQAELRRGMRRASRSPSRITIAPKEPSS